MWGKGTVEEAMKVRIEELSVNPHPRVAVALCLDVSGSMGGEPLAELNRGVQEFYRACKEDPQSSQSAEVAVIAFGSHARLVSDFCGISNAAVPNLNTTEGSTNLTAGVQLALERLNAAKEQYQHMGVQYHQPWFVLMTDGAPDGGDYVGVASQVVELESGKKLTVFPIGIGPYADMDVLAAFSNNRTPMKLNGFQFAKFFAWLSQSIARVSESQPGDAVKLPSVAEAGWGEA